MSDAVDAHYEAVFRNTPLAMIGFLSILAAAGVAAWAAFSFLPPGELLWPAVEIAGVSIAAIAAVFLLARSRRSWTIRQGRIEISEAPALSWLIGRTAIALPLGSIAAVRRVESGFDALLMLETADRAQYWIMQGFARDKAGVLLPDKEGFDQFANALRKRVAEAGTQRTSFHDGLGFWNRLPGLMLLGALFCVSLGLSGLIVYAMLSGIDMPHGAALQGLVLVLLTPLGSAYALYRSWARRSFVLGLGELREKLVSKETESSR